MESTDARTAVDAAMKAQGLTQGKLAERINSHPAAVSRALGSSLIDRRSLWIKILNALDLEVVIRPKSVD